MQAYLETVVCKFGCCPAICLEEEAIFVQAQKCPYHVTFDVDLDLEHILDAGAPVDYRVQVWSVEIYIKNPERTFSVDVI